MPYVPDALKREARIMPLPKSWTNIKPVVFGSAGATFTGIPAMPGIYRVVCLPMRRAYVGQAADLARRCLEHQVQLREGTHTNPRLLGAYQRFGPKAFCFQVLEIYTGRWSPDVLSPAEQRWMDQHGRQGLFNIRPAGSDAWLATVIGGKASSPRAKTGPKSSLGEDNRPLGRDNPRCDTCGGGFFKQRPKGAIGPKEVWQPCICKGLAQQLHNKAMTRSQAIGAKDEKGWRSKMPKKKPRG